MAKNMATQTSPPAQARTEPTEALAKPPEVVELLARADDLLRDGHSDQARDLIARARLASQWATNALGVCQLRAGNAKVALDVFRGLVLASGGLLLRQDVPVVFKTNYAAALLASDNLAGCLGVLNEVRDEQNPAVERLRGAIRRWQKSLTFWQKVNWWLGGHPGQPVPLDFPLRPGITRP